MESNEEKVEEKKGFDLSKFKAWIFMGVEERDGKEVHIIRYNGRGYDLYALLGLGQHKIQSGLQKRVDVFEKMLKKKPEPKEEKK